MKKQTSCGGFAFRRDNRMENRTQEPMKDRNIRLAVRVFLLVILQVSVVGRIGFFGAIPDLLLSHLVVIAVTGQDSYRRNAVSIVGIASGFLADVLGGVGVGFLTLFYFLVGAICSGLMRRSLRGTVEELICFYAVLCPVSLLRTGVTLLYMLIAGQGGFSLGIWLVHVMIPEFFGTMLFALPIFFLFRRRI